MDTVTRKVMEMYNSFPYPSAEIGRKQLSELSTLLRLLCMESELSLEGKRILDAGTGTGHRLAHAAQTYPASHFTAVDLCETSLSVARSVASRDGLRNVTHARANLMEELAHLGRFDLVLCIGVLHHLAAPEVGLRNLVNVLAPSGAIVLWLYGEIGGRERRKRRQIVHQLLAGRTEDYQTGIRLVKDLGYHADLEFGWDLGTMTERELDGLIVDAFLNINEKLYDVDSIHALMNQSGLAGYAISGVTSGNTSLLFDTAVDDTPTTFKRTHLAPYLKTPLLRQRYAELPILDRCRLVDLLCAPAGYTVIGFSESFLARLPREGRLWRNLVRI